MWQKCPVCEGKGFIEDIHYDSGKCTLTSTCPTCNGHRIISEVSGLPPEYNINESAVKAKEKQVEEDLINRRYEDHGFYDWCINKQWGDK